FGLTLDQVREAIQEANITVPAGELERGNLEVTLRTPGEFTDLEQLRSTVIAVRDGAPVYVHQVAEVEDSHRKVTQLVRINGKPGIRLAIRKQSDRNTVQIAQAVHEEVEHLRADFPQVEIVTVTDSARYIQQAIDNVTGSVVYGGLLAVLVLLLLLRDLRTTLVAAVAIPISVVVTFALIYFAGFTLNLMTLGGLALGVGMMVDNAIVVLENIARLRQEENYDPTRAAIEGTNQVAVAVVASTVTTLVIFLPMIFAEEMAGILFRQFAWIVGFSLLCSLVVSLTLVPMLAARFAQPADGTTHPAVPSGAMQRRWQSALDRAGRIFHSMEAAYGRFLDRALAHRLAAIGVAVGLFVLSLLLIPEIGAEFMPASDENEVRVTVEMEAGTRLPVLDERVSKIEERVAAAVPEAVARIVRVGGSSGRGSSTRGEITLTLVSAQDRSRSSDQIAGDLRRMLVNIPGVVIRTRAGQGLTLLRVGGGEDTESVEIDIRGYDFKTLDALAAEIQKAVRQVPGITDARLSREAGVRQDTFRIDRDRAADLGLSVTRIGRTIETAIAGSGAGEYREGGDEFRIVVKLKDAERMSLDQVLDLSTVNDRGEQVVLRNAVTTDTDRAPLQIERKDQQRIVTVAANISGRDLTGVVDDIEHRLEEIPMPRNYGTSISGDYEEQQKAFGELLLSLAFAIALVYMVMACLYESLVDPLIVMASVPFATVGVAAALLLTGSTFNVQSFIGCVMLVGIVVNNAILIVDQAAHLHRVEGRTPLDAACEAGRRRLRPILMTSLTTILGLIPLALGIGEGAETQAPLARAVIGGLLSSMLVTLVLIPVLYTLVHERRARRTVVGAAS
ncbi:MAG: efflux RND transporter permease subunit, partial [Alphaproteobacteria bacterium]